MVIGTRHQPSRRRAPFYDTYETADGRYVSVGAIERKFYRQFIAGLGLERGELPDQFDRARWPELLNRIATAFKACSRDHWEKVFLATDAYVFPVLSPLEAADGVYGQRFVDAGGVQQPAPAPRFSRTPVALPTGTEPGEVNGVLASWRSRHDDEALQAIERC
jgi:alpha-methylacyl-CoA racemase